MNSLEQLLNMSDQFSIGTNMIDTSQGDIDETNVVEKYNEKGYRRLLNKANKHFGEEPLGLFNKWEYLHTCKKNSYDNNDGYIDETCWKRCKTIIDGETKYSKKLTCFCGTDKVETINIFQYKNKQYSIGTSCIHNIILANDCKILFPELYELLKEVMKKAKDFDNERKKRQGEKKCLSCDGFTKINYKYKDRRRNYRCKNCIADYKMRCAKCNLMVVDCWKTSKFGFNYKFCKKCYSHERLMEQSQFLADSDSE